MEKLLEDIYHENEIVSKEKGRHWSHRAIDPRQRWEERSPQDKLWKVISGNQLCGRSREQPSRLEQITQTATKVRLLISRYIKNYTKKEDIISVKNIAQICYNNMNME